MHLKKEKSIVKNSEKVINCYQESSESQSTNLQHIIKFRNTVKAEELEAI